jgi:hypothetical protein
VQGDSAEFSLASVYETGRFVPQSDAQALKWYIQDDKIGVWEMMAEAKVAALEKKLSQQVTSSPWGPGDHIHLPGEQVPTAISATNATSTS